VQSEELVAKTASREDSMTPEIEETAFSCECGSCITFLHCEEKKSQVRPKLTVRIQIYYENLSLLYFSSDHIPTR
jgi:hypothetical protein